MIDSDTILVVTGCPRCGTTLMMRILEILGIPLYYDDKKPVRFSEHGTDFINYNVILRESEKLDRLKAGDGSWLAECKGKAVKILSPAKVGIPEGFKYKFIWMNRKLKNCARSNIKFLTRTRPYAKQMSMNETIAFIDQQQREGLHLIKNMPDSEYIIINFEELISKPHLPMLKLSRFLNIDINVEDVENIIKKRPAHCLPNMLEEEIYV